MSIRFSFADKISLTIVVVGIFGITLVYYISDSYRQFAYQHHTQAIQQLAYLEADDLLEDLKKNSLDLALSIENEKEFNNNFHYKYSADLSKQLDNQFYQYFVTAGVIKLLKLYILDTDFTLISTSSEGVKTNDDGELICPQLSQVALNRLGSERLQTLSRACTYKKHPVFAVIVPFGGLDPKGYIQVITDLAYNLQKIDRSLGMPIQMKLLDDHIIYQSENWGSTRNNGDYLDVELPVKNDAGTTILFTTLKSDMKSFNREVKQHRNWIMALAFVTTALTVFIVLFILRRSTIPPLAKIHDVLEKIHLHSHAYADNKNNRFLFEQLLEQIICIRKQSRTCFTVMILDLTRFKDVNIEFGNSVGDKLLVEVEKRLSKILRESDLISWIGTDTPGHKLLPLDTETKYRATIARLAGDEFGLLLPSAETKEQAVKVAQRIIETLNKTFEIDGCNINIECKIGISIFPIHGADEKLLIRNADKAMQYAKTDGEAVSVFNLNE